MSTCSLSFATTRTASTQITLGPATDVETDATGHATGQVAVGTPQYCSAELQATASAVQPGTRDPADDSYLWIMGAGEAGWDTSSEMTQIVADKKSYAPGDIAHLSIVSETEGFYALVIAQGYTVQMRNVMHSDGKTLSFDLPITSDSQPNITVDALFIKDNTLYLATKILKVPPTAAAVAGGHHAGEGHLPAAAKRHLRGRHTRLRGQAGQRGS